MKALAVTAAVVIVLTLGAWVAYRFLQARTFVAAGRGALDSEQAVQVLFYLGTLLGAVGVHRSLTPHLVRLSDPRDSARNPSRLKTCSARNIWRYLS
jgi:hypothetical protein